jgi:N-acetylglucosamine-6-phosphate deacetylase
MKERMTITIVHNGKLITPAATFERGYVIVEGERVSALGPGSPPQAPDAVYIDAAGRTIGPGFIDVHSHGADGHDAMDATPEALHAIAAHKSRHGVTAFLPTTMSDTPEAIAAALENIGACQGAVEGGAEILGAHVEGPFFNVQKRGAQPEAYIRPASAEEYEPWFDLCTIGVISLAPEVPENRRLITYARRRGAATSVGHSNATYEQVIEAIPLGLNHVTHTYNGMSGLHHRTPGVALAALTFPDLYAEIICDLHHVHPAMIGLLIRAKTPERVVLITDAIRATGFPDGEYMLGKQHITVKDGVPRTPEGSLGGSTATMDADVRNVVRVTGVSLADVWRMASLTPARSIGVEARKGSLEAGKDADIVLLDEGLNVILTLVKGKVVYNSSPQSDKN